MSAQLAFIGHRWCAPMETCYTFFVRNPHELQSAKDSAGVLVFPPLLLVLCAVAGVLTWWVVPSTPLPAFFSYPMAVLCTTAGLVLDRWAQRSLRGASTAVHPSHTTSVVVTSGAFARSRNPIYLAQGLLLAAVGFLLRGVAYFWVLVPWFAVIRVGVIAREERYLLGKFRRQYADYQKTVRRWI